MSEKRCELCNKHAASVHYTEIAESQVTKRFICRACAEKRGILDVPSKPAVALQELLSLPAQAAQEAEVRAVPDLQCRTCGLAFSQFRRAGRLGCPACYGAFESELVPLLRKIHAHARHTGKAPRDFATKAELRQRVNDLRHELERAVRAEDYERAAGLRDQIRSVELEQTVATRRAPVSRHAPAPPGGESA